MRFGLLTIEREREKERNFDANNFLLEYQGEEVVQDESKWNNRGLAVSYETSRAANFSLIDEKEKKKYVSFEGYMSLN